MEKTSDRKLTAGLGFMGHGLGELLELKASCRRRMAYLERNRESISEYVYSKLCQEYLAYLQAVDGEVALGLSEYEIRLAEIRLFSNQLKLLEKSYREKLEELSLRHSLGEFDDARYNALVSEHEAKMKRFAGSLEKYQGQKARLESFLSQAKVEQPATGLAEPPDDTVVETAGVVEHPVAEQLPAASATVPEPAVAAESDGPPSSSLLELEILEQEPATAQAEPELELPGQADITVSEQAALADSETEMGDLPGLTEQPAEQAEPDLTAEESPPPPEEPAAEPAVDLDEPARPEPEQIVEETLPEVEEAAEKSQQLEDSLPEFPEVREPSPEEAAEPEQEVPVGQPAAEEDSEAEGGFNLESIFGDSPAQEDDSQERDAPADSFLESLSPAEEDVRSESELGAAPGDNLPETAPVPAESGAAEEPEPDEGGGSIEDELLNDLSAETTPQTRSGASAPGSEASGGNLDLDDIMEQAGTAGTGTADQSPEPAAEPAAEPEPETAEDEVSEPEQDLARELEAPGESNQPAPEQTPAAAAEEEVSREPVTDETGLPEPEAQLQQDEQPEVVENEPAAEESTETEAGSGVTEAGSLVAIALRRAAGGDDEKTSGSDDERTMANVAVDLDDVELTAEGESGDKEAEFLLTMNQTIDAIKKKTIKCPNCGTLNYAIRWYCENCEATLTAL
ncbi:MAG: hypothetical protein FVQ81_14940 [Candidatus Glassbacteria bacterium]|nr:hypothetical protein [Candidatus Glassbacteria bacterium]